MFSRLTDHDRDRLAFMLVSLSMVLRMAEDAVLIAKSKGDHDVVSGAKIVSQGRDALVSLLGWVAGDCQRALDIAQMRLMELTAEKIAIGHAREIIDELADMRDVVSDLGGLAGGSA